MKRQTQVFTAVLSALISPMIANADVIRELSLPTNGIVFNPSDYYIYASVPSSAGVPRGNSITRVDPILGVIGNSTFIGSEPNRLSLSETGQDLYVSLDGAAAIRRFHVSSSTPGVQFSLGNGGSTGPFFAEDIEVVPGNPNAVAVSRRNVGFSPRHEGVAIYENGIMRPTTTPGHTGSNSIEFSATGGRLYGYNNETTEFGFRRMDVTSSGVSTISTTGGLISGFGHDIEYAGGRIYSTSGRVVDPEARILLGTYSASGIVEPDPQSNRTFFLTGSGTTRTLQAFDLTTFVPIGSLSIPNVAGTPTDLIRWGGDGLAFRTSANELFLINTSLVPEPNTLSLLFGAAALIRMRRASPR